MPNKSENISIRPLFRVIVPKFAKHNVFSGPAKKTTSLSAIIIATAANKALPWLDVEVIDENNYRQSLRGPKDSNGNPDHGVFQRERQAMFIGLCCSMTNAMPRALELTRLYRQYPVVKGIIAGGSHVHYEPTEILNAGAHAVVHGEGEEVIADLITAFFNDHEITHIPGISFLREGVIRRNAPHQLIVGNLDALPHPDFGLMRYAKIKIFPVGRTRGCSGQCEFCSIKARARSMSPERFLDQFRYLTSRGAREFFLVDDRTEEDQEGSLRFFKSLADFVSEKKLRLDITVQVRLSLAEDQEFLSAMKKAGVTNVCIGYESPIKAELRAMKKPINPEKMVEWTRKFKQAGFLIHAMFIFGYPLKPGEREQFQMSAQERAKHFWKFIKHAKRAGIDTIQILLLTPLLGTVVRERLEKEGRILKAGWEDYDGTHPLFVPDAGMTAESMHYEVMRLMRKFYAFNYLWTLKSVAMLAHLIKIGFVTILFPLQYFLSGFHFLPWYNQWRNSIIRFGGHMIIWRWLKNFKETKAVKLLRVKNPR